MLRWSIIFLGIALITAALGFGGIAGTATEIAKLLFFIFLILEVPSLIAMLVYALLAWIIVRLTWVIFDQPPTRTYCWPPACSLQPTGWPARPSPPQRRIR